MLVTGSQALYICRLCHAENKPTAKFCRRCGVARPQEEHKDASAVEATLKPVDHQAAPVVEVTRHSDESPANPCCETASSESRTNGGESRANAAAQAQREERPSQDKTVAESSEERALAEEIRKKLLAAVEAEPTGMPALSTEPVARRGGPPCVSCGTAIRALDKFCIWCGERQPDKPPPQMKRCAECRTHLPVNANFCYVCGNDVGTHPRKRIRVPVELFQEEDPELFPTFES